MANVQRDIKKAAVTRIINKIRRCIAERNRVSVVHSVQLLKVAFAALEVVHEAIIDEKIEEINQEAIQAEKTYLEVVREEYIKCVDLAKTFLNCLADSSDSDDGQLLTLPKIYDAVAKEAHEPVDGHCDSSSAPNVVFEQQLVSRTCSTQQTAMVKSECIMCNAQHELLSCKRLKEPGDQISYLNFHNLFTCSFLKNHTKLKCDKNVLCKICDHNCTVLVHVDNPSVPHLVPSASHDIIQNYNSVVKPISCHVNVDTNTICMPLRLLLYAIINNDLDVVALLDTAPTSTLVLRDVMDDMKLRHGECSFWLTTLNDEWLMSSMMIGLERSSSPEPVPLCVVTILVSFCFEVEVKHLWKLDDQREVSGFMLWPNEDGSVFPAARWH